MLLPSLTDDEKIGLAAAILELLEGWGLSPEAQIAVLALPAETKPRHLLRFRGGHAFPDDSAINERIEHIAGIADALRTSFPHNQMMGAMWLNRSHRRFGNRAPLAVILEDGLEGLVAVRSHLDCAFDWANDTRESES